MSNATKELEEAMQLLSLISVRGDAVDAMAAARSKIRKVLAELQNKEDEGGDKE